MLYVFDVDAGLMTTYDMSLTLESVASLKLAIERKTKIPASLLVLLVSGGDVLQSHHKVSSYSAGTDTNPIYMFSKPSVKDGSFKQPSQYSVCDLSPIVELSMEHWRSDTRSGLEMKSVSELKQAVEKSYALQPSVSTVVHCANLAQQFSELAHDMARCCEQHVHDQHLQHQGWSAVVANLEDIFNEFCERSKNFKENFKKHRQKKEQYHELLNSLNKVLEYLGRIPILPGLRQNAEAHRFSAFDVYEDVAGVFEGCDRLSGAFDNSGENRIAQDFGVDALRISEEDVFATQKQHLELDPKLSDQSSAEGGRIEESDEEVAFKAHSFENKEEVTLLHWILAQGNKASLQDIVDYCQKGLSLMDADPLKEREAELYKILEYANMHGLKQIRGIEERLRGLEMLLSDVRKLERDQHDQAQSLIQNRERVSNTVCDPSVLTTLVQSHRCQLETLLKNHQKLIDIRRRIAKSKEELSHILKARLEAVLMIENSMSVQDAHQMLSFQCFNRLARYFDIVEQLHRAPSIFAHAVNEVTRRRRFSDAFLTWTANLATNLLTIHDEEVSRRQEFNSKFHGHFLKTLFPGMGDLPPAFATQAPPYFDTKIPRLTDEDVDFVANSFPDLVTDVPKYDMEGTVKFFKHRFTISALKDKSVDAQTDTNRDFESETEGGDFERVSGQINNDNKQKIDISTICVPDTNAVSTVTEVPNQPNSDEEDKVSVNIEFVDAEFYIEESLPSSLEWGRDDKDNMDTHRIDMEKLREFINKLFTIYKSNMVYIKEELTKLKSEVEDQKKFINSKYIEILEAWEKNNEENALKFREQTQRLTVDHELELTDLKNVLTTKEESIESLKKQIEHTKTEHKQETERLSKDHECTKDVLDKTREEIKEYEAKISDMEVQKQKELKELQEKMHLEYKAEIESLRSRFRLVALTNMDRSPSESSLEKIERTDVIEIASHNAIVMQTKENAEVEKEEAVREAKEKCEMEWKEKMEAEIGQLKVKFEAEKQVTINDITRRLLSEKDRQIEGLREREAQLLREATKYKQTIEQLADQDAECDAMLKTDSSTDNVAKLESENAELQKQIEELKAKIEEVQKKSDDSEKSKDDESDNVIASTSRLWSHSPVGLAGGTLSVSACLPGHVVLLLWDPAHRNYTVLQEAPVMYFVHSDCLEALDLSITVKNENERKLYAVAIVESKEYCYAKRNANRYHMPRGSRFYRVRVKPYRQHPTNPPCCDNKHKQDSLKGAALPVFGEQRPVKKWLTYMHAPDSQKSSEANQSAPPTITENPEEPKVEEVETAALINLESPVGTAEPAPVADLPAPAHDDELDSIGTNDWSSRMMQASCVTDMECSVGRVLGPEIELPAEQLASSFITRAGSSDPPDSEMAEEATP